MRKLCIFIWTSAILTIMPICAVANVITMDANAYTTDTAAGWTEIYESGGLSLTHGVHYEYLIDDVDSSLAITGLNIIFHDFYNWSGGTAADFLPVSIFDNVDPTGTLSLLGVWYDDGVYSTHNDIVFSTSLPAHLAYLQNGSQFGIALDPQCHFYGDSFSVEVQMNAVPEPATMLLLGLGLVGLGGLSRKKAIK